MDSRGPQLMHNGDTTATDGGWVHGGRRDSAAISGDYGGVDDVRDRSNELSQRAKIG